jgi:hypothetical protein
MRRQAYRRPGVSFRHIDAILRGDPASLAKPPLQQAFRHL